MKIDRLKISLFVWNGLIDFVFLFFPFFLIAQKIMWIIAIITAYACKRIKNKYILLV